MNFVETDWVFVAKSDQVEDGISVGSSVWQHLPTGRHAIRGITGKYEGDILWINYIQSKRDPYLNSKTTVISVTSEKDGKEDTAYIDTDFAIKLIKLDVIHVQEQFKISVPSHRGKGKIIEATVEVDSNGNLIISRGSDGTPIMFCTTRNRVDLAVALLKVSNVKELIKDETVRKISRIVCLASDMEGKI